MYDGVGRRQDEKTGQLVNIGANSLNGRERKVLFRNDRDGTFTDVAWVTGADRVEDGRGLSIFDLDADGRQDMVVRNYLQPTILYRNEGAARNWISFKLRGTNSNRDAIGARIRIETGAGNQFREVAAGSGFVSSSSLVQHFGLGDEKRTAKVEIRWPSGNVTELGPLRANRRYVVTEGGDAVPATSPAKTVALR